jgi:hypothetical protein
MGVHTAIHDCLMEPFTNRYVLTGFDTHGLLIEVMYNYLGGDRVNVFHAMKCRDTLLELLEQGETYD